MNKELLIAEFVEMIKGKQNKVILGCDTEILELHNQYFYVSYCGVGKNPSMSFVGFKNPYGKVILENFATLSYVMNLSAEDFMKVFQKSSIDIILFKEAKNDLINKIQEMIKKHFLKLYPTVDEIPQEIKNLSHTSDEGIIKEIVSELLKNEDYVPVYSPSEIFLRPYISKETIYNSYGNEEALFEGMLKDYDFCNKQIIALFEHFRRVSLFAKAKEINSKKWGKYYRKIKELPENVSNLKFVYDKNKLVADFNLLMKKEMEIHKVSEKTKSFYLFETFKQNLEDLPSKVEISVKRDTIMPNMMSWYSIYFSNAEKILNKSESFPRDKRIYIIDIGKALFNEDNLISITYRGKDILTGEKKSTTPT